MRKRRSVVLYWSFSYTVILLLSLVSMALVYYATQKVVKQEITQANNSVMENAAQNLDQNLLMVKSTLYELKEDYTLSSLNNVQGSFRQLPPYQTYQASTRLQNALLSLPFIKEILVYYPKTESVVSSLTVASAAIYHYTYLLPKGITYSQWAESFQKIKEPGLLSFYFSPDDNAPPLLYYVYPLRNGMKLAAIIDPPKLVSGVELLNSDLYLVSAGGDGSTPQRLLAAQPSNELDWQELYAVIPQLPEGESVQTELRWFGGGQRMVSCKRSSHQDLFYYVSTPYNVFYSWYFFTQRIAAVGMILYLAVGIGVVFLSVRRQYQPVKKLIEDMEKESFIYPPPVAKNSNEFIFLSNSLNGLRHGRENLLKRRQVQEWESSLLRHIALGEGNLLPRFYESCSDSLRENGLAFSPEGMECWLAAFYLCDYGVRTGNEMRSDPSSPAMEEYYTYSRMVLRRTATEQLSSPRTQPDAVQVYLFDLKNVYIAAAFLRMENAGAYLEDMSSRICCEANAQIYMEADYVVLPKSCPLDKLSQGCENLFRRITEMEQAKAKGTSDLPDLPSRGVEPPNLFPPEDRRLLERHIRAHDLEKTSEMLSSLFRGYTLTGNATLLRADFPLAVSQLASFAIDFVKRTHLEDGDWVLQISQLLNDASAAENPVRILRELQELFRSIADAFELHSRTMEESSQQRMADDICSYIKRHYNDPNLSLSSLAIQFEMNVNQLSRTFRDLTGEGAPDYINHVRIDRAKQILCGEKYINLDDLAAQVGYNNTKTLIRSFKRFEDMTPGQYRDLHRSPHGDLLGAGKK